MRAAHGHVALYADRGALHVGDQIGLEQQIKAVTGGDAERGGFDARIEAALIGRRAELPVHILQQPRRRFEPG